MLLTLSQGITMGILVAAATVGGWYWGKNSQGSHEHAILTLNQDAPLVSVRGETIRLKDLTSESLFKLERLNSQIIAEARNLALKEAALRDIAKGRGVASSWRAVLNNELSPENLQKVYFNYPSFKGAGDFESVFPEVERYVIEIERNKLLGNFIAEVQKKNELSTPKYSALQVELPFELSEYPLIEFGSQNANRTNEVQVLFRYAGQLSENAFAVLEKIAADNGYLIPVRLLPELTESAYDRVAIASIMSSMRTEDVSSVRQLNRTLLKYSPRLADLANDSVVKSALSQVSNAQPANAALHPKGLAQLAEWYRDVRTSKLPIFFVNKKPVSDTHPQGFAFSLLSALQP